MKIAFKALIKNMRVKSLDCGEKEVDLMLRFRPEKGTVGILDELQKPDNEIAVVIMDEVVNNKEKQE